VLACRNHTASSFTVDALIVPLLLPAQAFHRAASDSFHSTYVHLLAAIDFAVERSVPSLSSMPTATFMPLPATYTQNPIRPLRDSAVLLPGLPVPESSRTFHDAEDDALSTSRTC